MKLLQLILFGSFLLSAGILPADDRLPPPPPAVIVAEVRLVEFADRVEAIGTLVASESVALTVNVTELVSAINFDDGDRVEAGQVLVEMTSDEEQAQLKEARAMVTEARRQHQRIKSLAAESSAAKSLLDQRLREWETARARLAAIESRLADRLVKAPFAGVLGMRDLSVGALVQPGDLITTLDDDTVMKLEFTVPATYLGVLKPGLDVIATTRAFAGQIFTGEVKSVDSRVDPSTRAVRVRALVPNPDRLLKPGMLMLVDLLGNPRETLMIPEEALVPLGDQQFVFVVNDVNEAVRTEIKTGSRRPGEVEVVDGLQAGDKVITHGTLKVKPGKPVTIIAVDDGSLSLPELLEMLRGQGQ